MGLVIGIFLAPVLFIIIYKGIWNYSTTKIKKIILHFILYGLSIIYVIISLQMEPFNIKAGSPADYMLGFAVLFVFSPPLWVDVFYGANYIYKKVTIRTNAQIKKSNNYIYYRDDLNKISPGVLMFTYKMDIDYKDAIAATLLKLKLDGFVREEQDKLVITDKNQSSLSESDKEVLKVLKADEFNKSYYYDLVKQETLDKKLLKKNRGNFFFRLFKIILMIAVPVGLYFASRYFDDYVFHKYRGENELMDILVLLSIIAVFVIGLATFFWIIQEIRYIEYRYKRTTIGVDLVNKAYALRNYLKEYSLIKDRSEKEVELWEYYMIYSVVLDVNEKISDEIINLYRRKV